MKCCDIRHCSENERNECYVWNSFRENPEELEHIKCWVLKGIYQKENREQFDKCRRCSYYALLTDRGNFLCDNERGIAVITGEGTINNEKSRALHKVWNTLKSKGQFRVILDLSHIGNIYSCGLGVLITIHKEAADGGGQLVVAGIQGYTATIFQSTKLSRLLTCVKDTRAAREKLSRREKPHPREDSGKNTDPPLQRIPCWEFWHNRNPRNATGCDDCFRKQKPDDTPCWMVEGVIEGVSFHYVNETCEGCDYYRRFNGVGSPAR